MYENYRNELVYELTKVFSNNIVTKVTNIVDELSRKYSISEQETLPAVINNKDREVDLYLGAKTVSGLSKETLRRYAYTLKSFCTSTNQRVVELTANDIRVYLFDYQRCHQISERSLDGIRSIINGFYGWCVAEGYLSVNPCANITKIKYERRQRESLDRLELEEVRRTCGNDLRLKAIVEFLYSTGCRVTEMTKVKMNDIDWNTGRITVIGKGNKERNVFMNAKCRLALSEYLSSKTYDSNYVFSAQRKPHGKLSKEIIDRIFKQTFAELSKSIGKPISPHVLRHTTATLGLQSGMDITVIQKMLGHESVSTTMIYAQVSDSSVEIAHKKYIV